MRVANIIWENNKPITDIYTSDDLNPNVMTLNGGYYTGKSGLILEVYE